MKGISGFAILGFLLLIIGIVFVIGRVDQLIFNNTYVTNNTFITNVSVTSFNQSLNTSDNVMFKTVYVTEWVNVTADAGSYIDVNNIIVHSGFILTEGGNMYLPINSIQNFYPILDRDGDSIYNVVNRIRVAGLPDLAYNGGNATFIAGNGITLNFTADDDGNNGNITISSTGSSGGGGYSLSSPWLYNTSSAGFFNDTYGNLTYALRSRNINTTYPLGGGGNLSVDRVLTFDNTSYANLDARERANNLTQANLINSKLDNNSNASFDTLYVKRLNASEWVNTSMIKLTPINQAVNFTSYTLRYDEGNDTLRAWDRGFIGNIPVVIASQFWNSNEYKKELNDASCQSYPYGCSLASNVLLPANFFNANRTIRVTIGYEFSGSAFGNSIIDIRLNLNQTSGANFWQLVDPDTGGTYGGYFTPLLSTVVYYIHSFTDSSTSANIMAYQVNTGDGWYGRNNIITSVNVNTTQPLLVTPAIYLTSSVAGHYLATRSIIIEDLGAMKT